MAGITLVQAEARLALYLDAEAKVLAGQEVRIDGELMRRADLEMIQKGVSLWEGRVQRLANTSGGLKVREVIPR
jgi:hypothetical protein